MKKTKIRRNEENMKEEKCKQRKIMTQSMEDTGWTLPIVNIFTFITGRETKSYHHSTFITSLTDTLLQTSVTIYLSKIL
jgi:hypothetical protein